MTGHVYLSTACWHAGKTKDREAARGLHGHCRESCKWCQAPCHCVCHVPSRSAAVAFPLVGVPDDRAHWGA